MDYDLKEHSQNRYFLLFILLFAYMESIHSRIAVGQDFGIYLFTPEAAILNLIGYGILFLILRFYIKKWQISDVFETRNMLKIFGTSLLTYLLIMQTAQLLIALAFDTFDRNYTNQTFILSVSSNILNGLIYGSFFLAYHYFQRNRKHQQQLFLYNLALSESKISQLKAQLNPHFLFNNLNILDQLIEEDKVEASNFLNDFADIYRYVLSASDKKTVSINDELEFAKNYFKLYDYKYGDAYQLQVETIKTDGYIVPLTLQLLIENAIQHNLGTIKDPIVINILVANNIMVSNNRQDKKHSKNTSGRALRNLKEQYQLMTTLPVMIEQNNQVFSVTVPLLKSDHL